MKKNLMDLSDLVLMEVLKFVPNRFEVALVCKKFYELICDIEKNRYKMKIGQSYNEVRFNENLIDLI